MARGAAARRYAKALFELARDADRVVPVRDELDTLGGLLDEHEELASVLLQPLHPASQRRGVLNGLLERMNASELLRHFLAFLIDQRRLLDLEAIRGEYARLADEAAGKKKALVVAARPLRDEQVDRLRSALSARTGQDLELEVEIDPKLLGGVVAKVGDLVFDGSLRTQLEQLRGALADG